MPLRGSLTDEKMKHTAKGAEIAEAISRKLFAPFAYLP
jgi:hypothetical protein